MAFAPRVPAETWAAIRAQREAGDSFHTLAKRHGVAVNGIHKRAKAEGWKSPPTKKPAPPKRPKKTVDTTVNAKGGQPKVDVEVVHRQSTTPGRLPPALLPTMWRAGESGNPGGLPKTVHNARRNARALTEDAVERARQMMMSEHPAVAAQGIAFILTWGMPKPKHEEPEKPKLPALDFRSMTPAELDVADAMLKSMEQLQAMQAARLSAEAKAAAPEIIPPGELSEPEQRHQAEGEDDSR